MGVKFWRLHLMSECMNNHSAWWTAWNCCNAGLIPAAKLVPTFPASPQAAGSGYISSTSAQAQTLRDTTTANFGLFSVSNGWFTCTPLAKISSRNLSCFTCFWPACVQALPVRYIQAWVLVSSDSCWTSVQDFVWRLDILTLCPVWPWLALLMYEAIDTDAILGLLANMAGHDSIVAAMQPFLV